MDKKMKQAGKKLDVSNKDVRDIRKAGLAFKVKHWIIGLIIAVIAFIAGYFSGGGTCPSSTSGGSALPPEVPPGGSGLPEGYPYAFVPILGLRMCKTRKSKIAVLLFSALAFFVAMKAAPVFGEAIKYNVFKRR